MADPFSVFAALVHKPSLAAAGVNSAGELIDANGKVTKELFKTPNAFQRAFNPDAQSEMEMNQAYQAGLIKDQQRQIVARNNITNALDHVPDNQLLYKPENQFGVESPWDRPMAIARQADLQQGLVMAPSEIGMQRRALGGLNNQSTIGAQSSTNELTGLRNAAELSGITQRANVAGETNRLNDELNRVPLAQQNEIERLKYIARTSTDEFARQDAERKLATLSAQYGSSSHEITDKANLSLQAIQAGLAPLIGRTAANEAVAKYIGSSVIEDPYSSIPNRIVLNPNGQIERDVNGNQEYMPPQAVADANAMRKFGGQSTSFGGYSMPAKTGQTKTLMELPEGLAGLPAAEFHQSKTNPSVAYNPKTGEAFNKETLRPINLWDVSNPESQNIAHDLVTEHRVEAEKKQTEVEKRQKEAEKAQKEKEKVQKERRELIGRLREIHLNEAPIGSLFSVGGHLAAESSAADAARQAARHAQFSQGLINRAALEQANYEITKRNHPILTYAGDHPFNAAMSLFSDKYKNSY